VLYLAYPERGMEGLRVLFLRWGLVVREVEGGGEEGGEGGEEDEVAGRGGVKIYILEVRLADRLW
jgi:hypothetical protein